MSPTLPPWILLLFPIIFTLTVERWAIWFNSSQMVRAISINITSHPHHQKSIVAASSALMKTQKRSLAEATFPFKRDSQDVECTKAEAAPHTCVHLKGPNSHRLELNTWWAGCQIENQLSKLREQNFINARESSRINRRWLLTVFNIFLGWSIQLLLRVFYGQNHFDSHRQNKYIVTSIFYILSHAHAFGSQLENSLLIKPLRKGIPFDYLIQSQSIDW